MFITYKDKKVLYSRRILFLLLAFVLFKHSYALVETEDTVSKIFLVHTDVLYKNSNDPRAEVLVGNVVLSHKGAYLYCDSAKYYRRDNSFDAFGDVRMVQGDTLSLDSDSLF